MSAVRSDHEPPRTRALTVVTARASSEAFLALPADGACKSAVVVVGDGVVLDAHALDFARRLAGAGHATLSMGHEATTSSFAGVTERINAALACLVAESGVAPRFGVVGFGKGGFSALVAGYRCQVGAAVCFYGEGPARLGAELVELVDRPRPHAASVLLLVGGEDAAVRPTDLSRIHDRLAVFRMRHTFIIYPRTRGEFFRTDSVTYSAAAADDAWQRLLHVLETAPRLRHRFTRTPRGDAPRR